MRRGSWFKKRVFTKGYPMGPRRNGIQMGKCSGEPLGVRASDMEPWRRGLPVGIGREWERMSRGREVEPLLSGGKVEKKVVWWESGKKRQETNYKKGVPDGWWVEWKESGAPDKKAFFKNGKASEETG